MKSRYSSMASPIVTRCSSGSPLVSMIPAFCALTSIDLCRRGFDQVRKITDRLALSLSLLVPLQVVPPFRMVFIRARNEDVVGTIFPFRSRTAESFQTPPTRTFLRILTRSAYCLDRAMVPPSIGEDTTVGSRIGQTEEEWTPKRTPKEVSD